MPLFSLTIFPMSYIKYTKEMIQEAVNRSFTWAEACRQLGVKTSSGSQTHFTKRAKFFGVDYKHFYSKSEASSRLNKSKPRDVKEYLKPDGPLINSHALKVKLIRCGMKGYRCEQCLGAEWRGSPMPLELHHVDGNRLNNTIGNLQILCPNCHSMTPNNSGKNIRRCG